jgi:hypothetical protein
MYWTAISANQVLAELWYDGLATKCLRRTKAITSKDDIHFTPHGFLMVALFSKVTS